MSLCLMRNILSLLFLLLAYAPLNAQAFQKRYAEPGGRYLIAHDVRENNAGDFGSVANTAINVHIHF